MSIPISDDEIERWPQTFTYNGNNKIETITATKSAKTGSDTAVYVKTFTWSGDNLQSVTAWVKQ